MTKSVRRPKTSKLSPHKQYRVTVFERCWSTIIVDALDAHAAQAEAERLWAEDSVIFTHKGCEFAVVDIENVGLVRWEQLTL
jgi:hypothetical protein